MGNRAIIKAEGNDNKAVYLHWNGGRDSVEAFLKYCELRGFRGFDDPYGMARFCQVVGNFFGPDGLSLGIMDCAESHGDNGVYIVRGWEIVGREDHDHNEQKEYEMNEMLIAIDESQPQKHQLGEFLKVDEVDIKDVKVGDLVFIMGFRGNYEKHEVVGIGEDIMVNGRNVKGLPYVEIYGVEGSYHLNINNYIRDNKVRIGKNTPDNTIQFKLPE